MKMKSMLVVIALMMVTLATTAQTKSKVAFSIGGELGVATGNLNIPYSIGIGATAQLDYAMDENAAITFNSGIIEFIGKKIKGTNTKYRSVAVIPFLGGVKYYFTTNLYGAAQLGASVFTQNGSGAKFTYSPGLGFKVNERVDALVKYTGYTDLGGSFGVRVAYTL